MQTYLKQKTRIFPPMAVILLIVCLAAATACDYSSVPKESEKLSATGQTKPSNGTDKDSEAKKPKVEKTVTDKKADDLIEVYDGQRETTDIQEKKFASEVQNFVAEEVKKHEKEITEKAKNQCDDKPEPFVVDIAEGSFTKPASSQTIYLYELCRSGRAFGIGGFIIAENGKSVSHYIYGENGLEMGLFSLPDINKNGISEIVFIGGGTGQGYTRSAIDIFEINNGNPDYFGQAETFSSNDGAVEKDADILTTARKIFVQPLTVPIFYREVYEQRGNSQNWKKTKKSEKFDLNKSEPFKIIKLY